MGSLTQKGGPDPWTPYPHPLDPPVTKKKEKKKWSVLGLLYRRLIMISRGQWGPEVQARIQWGGGGGMDNAFCILNFLHTLFLSKDMACWSWAKRAVWGTKCPISYHWAHGATRKTFINCFLANFTVNLAYFFFLCTDLEASKLSDNLRSFQIVVIIPTSFPINNSWWK